MNKPNCYECKHRRNVAGDAHSQCVHPKSCNTGGDMFDAIVAMISQTHSIAAQELEIQANAHGVRSGWFMWPANFDPCWLENCNGFEQK